MTAVYFGFLAKADILAFGMLLAVGIAVAGERLYLTGWSSAFCRLSGLGIFVAAFLLRGRSDFVFLFFHTFCGVAAFLWLASIVLETRGSIWKRVLEYKGFKFLGLISYSIYIWHEPIMIGLSRRAVLRFDTSAVFPFSAVALLGISVLAGALSYYAIEYPTQFMRDLFTREGRLVNRYPE